MSLFYRAGILSIILIFALISGSSAQSEADPINTLAIDIWPDYDRAAVLVLMTGSFSEDVALPASVVIPLPPDADLNAVARITDDFVMTDDVEYTLQADTLVFQIPDRRFRVEYYYPYTEVGDERRFDFSWLADVSVDQLEVAVQQPTSATTMETVPAPANISRDSNDGLTYHILPAVPVSAGVPYDVSVTYAMPSPALTANQSAPPPEDGSSVPAAAVDAEGFDWPLLLAGLGLGLILAAVIWQVATNRNKKKRPSRKPAKPKPVRPAKATAKANFCHECGEAVKPDDKFCRACGTAVKQL